MMKSKLIFFVIITLFIAIKKSYLYLSEVQSLVTPTNVISVNNSVFDSLEDFDLYKKQVLQIVENNKFKVGNLKLLMSKENKVINEKFEKQIEIVEFKNIQLNKSIGNYNFQTVEKFLFYKKNLNVMLAENNQLISEILEKHEAILKIK
jgi:hypothetical protein